MVTHHHVFDYLLEQHTFHRLVISAVPVRYLCSPSIDVTCYSLITVGRNHLTYRSIKWISQPARESHMLGWSLWNNSLYSYSTCYFFVWWGECVPIWWTCFGNSRSLVCNIPFYCENSTIINTSILKQTSEEKTLVCRSLLNTCLPWKFLPEQETASS